MFVSKSSRYTFLAASTLLIAIGSSQHFMQQKEFKRDVTLSNNIVSAHSKVPGDHAAQASEPEMLVTRVEQLEQRLDTLVRLQLELNKQLNYVIEQNRDTVFENSDIPQTDDENAVNESDYNEFASSQIEDYEAALADMEEDVSATLEMQDVIEQSISDQSVDGLDLIDTQCNAVTCKVVLQHMNEDARMFANENAGLLMPLGATVLYGENDNQGNTVFYASFPELE